MMNFKHAGALKNTLRSHLAAFRFSKITQETLRPAAVALVVAPGDDETCEATVLLTLRPAHIKRHKGQYALPGGRLEAGETVVQAALRELEEELGLVLSSDDMLGQLDDYATRSGYCISPVVFWVDCLKSLKADPNEVAEIYRLPFRELNSDDIPVLSEGEKPEAPVLAAWFPVLGHHVYAPTAALLYQFREVAMQGRETRVAHFDQPAFAWK